MSTGPAPAAARHRTQLPALATGVALMLAATADPRFLTDAAGKVDHLLVLAVCLAMTAGFVRGVGFIPRTAGVRWLLSGWACLAALSTAAAIWVLR